MKMVIFKYIRDPRDFDKIRGKLGLRAITVHSSFQGIGAKGEINRAEFERLASSLESDFDGIDIT